MTTSEPQGESTTPAVSAPMPPAPPLPVVSADEEPVPEFGLDQAPQADREIEVIDAPPETRSDVEGSVLPLPVLTGQVPVSGNEADSGDGSDSPAAP